ncbi:MAG: ATP-binding protein [Bacteroidia bacterium]|nr:ATP-binding protein [Bacteroidia bacterium]
MIRRIAIVGPESTGKSLLSAQLAAHFAAPWVPEHAREYLTRLGRPYAEADLLEIARGQLALEAEMEQQAAGWLFCDTNLLVIKVWSEYKYGRCHPEILQRMALDRYALHLLADIDLPWEDDPLREHPHRRAELFGIYHAELRQSGLPAAVVRGLGEERLQSALEALRLHGLC